MKELNKNLDKETRIKFLRSEVRKRETLLKKRMRRARRYRSYISSISYKLKQAKEEKKNCQASCGENK